MDIDSLQKRLREFANERDWVQYHNPKNLSMALVVEAAELVEMFQWLTPEESLSIKSNTDHVAEEIADIFLYLIRIADVLDIDLPKAVEQKLEKNKMKYPAEGSNTPRSKGKI